MFTNILNKVKKLFGVFLFVSLTLACLQMAFPASTTLVQTGPQISNGVVVGIQPLTALKIVSSAANGCPECYRWTKEFADGSSGFMFAKPFKDLWGFVNIGTNQEVWSNITQCGGNATNCKTFSEFVASLEANGWKQITAAEVPAWIAKTSAFMVASYNSFKYASYATAQTRGTFFILVPPAAFESYAAPDNAGN